MNLVNKEDNFSLAFLHLFQYSLQAILELTTIFCSCNQSPQIKSQNLLSIQGLWDISRDNTLCQSFNNCCLTDSWLTDKHWIIFGTATQYLNNTPHLIIPANHRIQFSLLGQISQIAGIFFQGLIFLLWILISDALTAADIGKRLQKLILADAFCFQHTCALGATFIQQGKKKMFLADILIPHTASLLKRLIKDLFQTGRGISLTKTASADLGKLGQKLPCFTAEYSRVNSYFLQDRYNDPVHLAEKYLQKMLRHNLLVGVFFSKSLGLLNSLLGFYGKFIKLHFNLLLFILSAGKNTWPEGSVILYCYCNKLFLLDDAIPACISFTLKIMRKS